jgi:hypothetical protein
LIALMILSTTIVLAIQAGEIARRVSLAAEETRRADEVARALLAESEAGVSERQGASDAFLWTLRTETAPGSSATQGVRVCRRMVSVTSKLSGRAYRVTTANLCPADDQHEG